eukprot:8779094-Alexandrium_andersonii.AAC.1
MLSAVCLCGAPPPVPCSYHAAEQTRRGEARPASAGTQLQASGLPTGDRHFIGIHARFGIRMGAGHVVRA